MNRPGVFETLGSPATRQEAVLRKSLESRRDNWHREGFVYRGGGDLLLQHGKFYSGRELPAEYEHHYGEEGQCFMNALLACKADPALRYVEGVYAIGTSHYTPHAWCLDPNGELLEVTMPTSAEIIAIGREHKTGLPILPLEHWGYWGAIFHPEYVEAVWALQDDHVGILDRPSQERFDQQADPSLSITEWREDWHVLRKTYDPDRRQP